MRKLLPLLLACLGLGAGLGAGYALRPPAEGDMKETEKSADLTTPRDYVKLSNQFVVPVLEGGRVTALVILSVTLEVTTGNGEAIYTREPKLRDAFLQVMFDHANAGGFRGTFTDGSNMVFLRQALREAAQRVTGEMVTDVLIVDIVRQDS